MLLLSLAGCGDDGGDGGSSGAGAGGLGGVGGTTGGTSGTTGGVGGMGGTGGASGAAGMTGGMGGMTGGTGGMTGGMGGMTGGMGGMTGGMGGMTGGMGGMTGGMGGTGGGFMRGEDPTEATTMAMGPYAVGEITEADGLRDGDAYGDAGGLGDGATVYYPTDATPPFGGIAIVPGYLYTRGEMSGWGPFLASHGIVVMNIDPNNVMDQPATRSLGLIDALESVKGENTRAGSPLEGKLDTSRFGIMGWSMGGGGTWITADTHPELKVAISLCGWIIGAQGSTTTVASLQLAALGDPLADQMSQPIYEAIPAGTPKMLIEFNGGDHFIGNRPTNASGQIGKYALSWIKVYLEGDDRYTQFLESEPTGTNDVKRSL